MFIVLQRIRLKINPEEKKSNYKIYMYYSLHVLQFQYLIDFLSKHSKHSRNNHDVCDFPSFAVTAISD